MADVWTKIKQTVDTSVEDRAFVAKFEEQVAMLAGMVVEAVRQNPVWLLSPLMRQSLADKADEVERMRSKLAGRLVADNPCENFK